MRLQWRIGGVEAGIAFDLEAAHHIKNAHQAHIPDTINRHRALGIKFPFVMRHTLGRRFGDFEQHGDP